VLSVRETYGAGGGKGGLHAWSASTGVVRIHRNARCIGAALLWIQPWRKHKLPEMRLETKLAIFALASMTALGIASCAGAPATPPARPASVGAPGLTHQVTLNEETASFQTDPHCDVIDETEDA
jgi:hypothetical protein